MEQLKNIEISMKNNTFENRNSIKQFVCEFLKIVEPAGEEFKGQYNIFPFRFYKDNQVFFEDELSEGFYICVDTVCRGENSYELSVDVLEHTYYLGKRLNEDRNLEVSDEVLEYLHKMIPSVMKKYQKNIVVMPSWSEAISSCGYFGGRIIFDIEVKYGKVE